MKNKVNGIVIGLIFVLIGVAYAGNALYVWDFSIFSSGWWTMFIIIPCVLNMINNRVNALNLIGAGVGVILLLDANDIINNRVIFKLIFPAILVVIGLSIVYNTFFANKKVLSDKNNDYVDAKFEKAKAGNSSGVSSYSAIFSGNDQNFDSVEVGHLKGTAIFGGITFDLRHATVLNDIGIDLTCVFGGIDVYLPSHVKVVVNGTPILGGVDNKFKSSNESNAPVVHINYTCIFGGIDIK